MTGFPKFMAVSGVGFLIDILLAFILHERFGIDLWLAATCSFFTIAVLNYFLFEYWIFNRLNPGFSWRRLLAVLFASVFAVSARVATILGLSLLFVATEFDLLANTWLLLISGGAVSVVLNFVINKKLVFARIQ